MATIFDRFADRLAAWQSRDDKLPVTGRFLVGRIVALVVVVGLGFVRDLIDNPLAYAVAVVVPAIYAGLGIAAPLRARGAYERGYRDGRRHPDGFVTFTDNPD